MMDHMGDWLDRDDLTEADIRAHMAAEGWTPAESVDRRPIARAVVRSPFAAVGTSETHRLVVTQPVAPRLKPTRVAAKVASA